MARSAELRQEAQAMADVERVLALAAKLPPKMRARVLTYAVDAANDSLTALGPELEEAGADPGAG